MRGVVQNDGNRVSFKYSFEGRVERGTDRTQPNSGATASMDRFQAVESFQGNADAVLSGDRGNMMQCRFFLTDVILGFRSGGFGLCELSDGRVIDVFY
jgi:hypothetical protein